MKNVNNLIRFINEHKERIKSSKDPVSLLGIRNKHARVNHFDDYIIAFYKRHDELNIEAFEATTLPGSPSLLLPINVKGTAILLPGTYKYKLGLHRGKYEALVQAEKVKVYRDNDLDLEYDLDYGTIDEGFFGINIHRASLKAVLVGANSAGCQVIRYRDDYDRLIAICKEAKQVTFNYTLVE